MGGRIESQHLPLFIELAAGPKNGDQEREDRGAEQGIEISRFRWKNECAEKFKIDLEKKLNYVNSTIVESLTGAIQDIAARNRMIMKQNTRRNGHKGGWYDQDCKRRKKEVEQVLRIFKREGGDEKRIEFVRKRKEYRKMLKCKQGEWGERLTAKILQVAKNGGRGYVEDIKWGN